MTKECVEVKLIKNKQFNVCTLLNWVCGVFEKFLCLKYPPTTPTTGSLSHKICRCTPGGTNTPLVSDGDLCTLNRSTLDLLCFLKHGGPGSELNTDPGHEGF